MKLTIDIDDELMAQLKDVTCAKTNEEAVLTAAENTSQLLHMKEFFSRGPHPTGKEIRNAWDPDFVRRTLLDLLEDENARAC